MITKEKPLAQRHVLRLDGARAKIAGAQRTHPEHEHEGENDLDEKRQQNSLE